MFVEPIVQFLQSLFESFARTLLRGVVGLCVLPTLPSEAQKYVGALSLSRRKVRVCVPDNNLPRLV